MNGKNWSLKVGNTPLWKCFLFVMIGCFLATAFVGIVFILVGNNIGSVMGEFLGRFCATSAVIGLFSLFTMNNLFRLESKKQHVKIASIAALALNLIWVIPWLLLVWNAFDWVQADCHFPNHPSRYSYESYYDDSYQKRVDDYYESVDNYYKCKEPYENAVTMAWRIMGSGIILAVLMTLAAEFLGYEDYNQTIKIMKYVTLGLGLVVAGYALLMINISDFQYDDVVTRMVAVDLIIFIFCVVVTPILVKVQKKKQTRGATIASSVQAPVAVADEDALKAQIRAEVDAELREKIRAEILAEMKAGTAKPEEKDEEAYLNGK